MNNNIIKLITVLGILGLAVWGYVSYTTQNNTYIPSEQATTTTETSSTKQIEEISYTGTLGEAILTRKYSCGADGTSMSAYCNVVEVVPQTLLNSTSTEITLNFQYIRDHLEYASCKDPDASPSPFDENDGCMKKITEIMGTGAVHFIPQVKK